MNDARFSLRNDDLLLEVRPGIGGAVTRFERLTSRGVDPIFRAAAEPYRDVIDSGCYPLVPFSSRVRGGIFVRDGRTITLPPNMAGDRSPLHGQGWRATWTVERHDERVIELFYDHEADSWPWWYRAGLRYQLEGAELRVRLTCRNLSADAMPCGLGLHPMFACDGGTRLDTSVTHVWETDADLLPVARVPAVGRYDLRDRAVCGEGLDNAFEGWSGLAEVVSPARDLRVRMTCGDATRLQVYAPVASGFFAAEPVQNAIAALNAPQEQWESLGIAMLAEGETATLTVVFAVS